MSHAVTVRPIRTDADLDAALARLDTIYHAVSNTPEGDEREVLATLIHDYERRIHPVERASDRPISQDEALRFHMDRLGLSESDLVAHLGKGARVSEVIAGKRPLTIVMIARLTRGLGIPAEDLLGM